MSAGSDDRPGTPWDVDIYDLIQLGMPPALSADLVIIDWLKCGNTIALIRKLEEGYIPGPDLRRYLAWMLDGEHLHPELRPRVPFYLIIKSRDKRGRPQNREKVTRNRKVAGEVRALMATGMSYDAAVATVQENWHKTGTHIGRQTIRDAYDERHGKKSRI